MDKISYAQFCREVNEKNLSLLLSGFYEGSVHIPEILAILDDDRLFNKSPINSGIATVQSAGFYRTMDDGRKSYTSKLLGTSVYKVENNGSVFYCMLSPVNYIFYKAVK